MTDFGRLVKKASAQMSRRFGRFARRYHLTAVQMSLIDYLCVHKQREIFQRDVEHEFLIRRSTASVMLKRMEKRDLLTRRPSDDDARQLKITLTPKSLKLERTVVQYMHHQQRRVEQYFSPAEARLLVKLLNTLIQINQ